TAGARSRARGEEVARRQRVGRVAGRLAHRQAQLLADTVTARLGGRCGRDRRGGTAGSGGRLAGRGRWGAGFCRRLDRGGRLGEGALPPAARPTPGRLGRYGVVLEVVPVVAVGGVVLVLVGELAAGQPAEQVRNLAQRGVDEQQDRVSRQEQQHG